VDEALTKLKTIDPDTSRMTELRFFCGLSVEETAQVMGVYARTITRSRFSRRKEGQVLG
jgi:ECF sigma factor.